MLKTYPIPWQPMFPKWKKNMWKRNNCGKWSGKCGVKLMFLSNGRSFPGPAAGKPKCLKDWRETKRTDLLLIWIKGDFGATELHLSKSVKVSWWELAIRGPLNCIYMLFMTVYVTGKTIQLINTEDYWSFPEMRVPTNHPKLDQFSTLKGMVCGIPPQKNSNMYLYVALHVFAMWCTPASIYGHFFKLSFLDTKRCHNQSGITIGTGACGQCPHDLYWRQSTRLLPPSSPSRS